MDRMRTGDAFLAIDPFDPNVKCAHADGWPAVIRMPMTARCFPQWLKRVGDQLSLPVGRTAALDRIHDKCNCFKSPYIIGVHHVHT